MCFFFIAIITAHFQVGSDCRVYHSWLVLSSFIILLIFNNYRSGFFGTGALCFLHVSPLQDSTGYTIFPAWYLVEFFLVLLTASIIAHRLKGNYNSIDANILETRYSMRSLYFICILPCCYFIPLAERLSVGYLASGDSYISYFILYSCSCISNSFFYLFLRSLLDCTVAHCRDLW